MYDKSILAKSTGASLGVVAVVGMLFLSTGTAFAAPIAGIGGFTISADSITGQDFSLYPGGVNNPNDAENTDTYPTGVVELGEVTIDNLVLEKQFDLSQYAAAGNPGRARILITAGSGSNVTADSLLLKTPQLQANTATFNGLVIDESNSSDISNIIELRSKANPNEAKFSNGKNINLAGAGASGNALALQDPVIQGTYLATNSITLPNLKLEVQYDPNDDGTYEVTGNGNAQTPSNPSWAPSTNGPTISYPFP